MVVAPALGVDEAVTEAASYPESGDFTPSVPEPEIVQLPDVPSNFVTYLGDRVVIVDMETQFQEVFVVASIDYGSRKITGYRPGD